VEKKTGRPSRVLPNLGKRGGGGETLGKENSAIVVEEKPSGMYELVQTQFRESRITEETARETAQKIWNR